MRILISGASIAGPACALLLSRLGHDVTVVERAPSMRPGGQTVDLRGAGRTVIERMGLADAVAAQLLDQRGLAYVDDAGTHRAVMPVEAFGGHGIVSSHEILRGDLAKVLYDATTSSVSYVWDDTVTAIEGGTVSFEKHGTETFDLVIGADGLHSAVRKAAFSDVDVRPIGIQTTWFTAAVDRSIDGWFLMHNQPGGLVATVRPSHNPDEVKAGLSVRTNVEIDRRNPEAQWRFFEERFAGSGWLIPQLLREMRTAPDYAFDSLAQVRMPSWTNGRVALVGDAGYCPTALSGLGTTLALVGAYVLAGELDRHDVETALGNYDAIMRPFVTDAQNLPPMGTRGFAPGTRFEIALGRASIRAMNRWPMRSLFAAEFAKAGAIALPNYEMAH